MPAGLFYRVNEENLSTRMLCLASKIPDDISDYEHNCLVSSQFQGALGEVVFIYDATGHLLKVFVGMKPGLATQALAIAATKVPPGDYVLQQTVSFEAQIAWALAQYKFATYKKDEWVPRVLITAPQDLASILIQVDAIFLIRDLINRPANDLTPETLAHATEALAVEYGATFQQWVGDALKQQFPAVYAVGGAAAVAPRFIELSWGKIENPLIILVGKGVCFDSGGLDIKTSGGMRLMKKDMGGAAQALGLAKWIMAKNLPIRLRVLLPSVENAVGSHSYRPGDVLTMRNGLTVEIDNTDAEGRLILADALSKACEEKPELLIDFATLTGAARSAVGTEISAMFTPDDNLAKELTDAAVQVDDPICRLPLYEGYIPLFASQIADLANSSASPYAGAITAALFLKFFVKAEIPWVHFDLMAWNVSSKPGKPEGGEAMAIRAVGYYLEQCYGCAK